MLESASLRSLATALPSAAGALTLLALITPNAEAQSGLALAELADQAHLRADQRSEQIFPSRARSDPRLELLPLAEKHQVHAFTQNARTPRSDPSASFPIEYGRGVRRTLLMGLTGAAAGAFAGGMMELVDPHGEIADVWPVLLAIPGFVAGVAVSIIVPAGPQE